MGTKKIFEHKCTECEAVSEHWVYWEEKTVDCPHCGAPATRIISATRWLENKAGVDGSFPGAAMKWEKDTTRRHRDAGQSHQDSSSQKGGMLK